MCNLSVCLQREHKEKLYIMKPKKKQRICGTNLAAWQQAKQPCNKIKKTCRLSFDPRISTMTMALLQYLHEQNKTSYGPIKYIQYHPANQPVSQPAWLQQPRRIGINCVWCLETNKKCLILMSSFFIYVLIWWYFRCLSMKLNYGKIDRTRSLVYYSVVWCGVV